MLVALVNSGALIVTKDELMRRIWPNTFVGENNLTVIISMLRKILGESCADHSYIVTIPGIGYRFVAKVNELSASEASALRQRKEGGVPQPTTVPEKIRAIAVLPFKSLTGENSEPHLGLRLTDALITRLGRLRQLIVRPTSTVSRFGSPRQDPIAAGLVLGVDAVLDAHFQLVGDRIRLTAQFVRVQDGQQLWTETFDENFSGLFSVQDSISKHLAEILMLNLGDGEKAPLGGTSTARSEAYEASLIWAVFLE